MMRRGIFPVEETQAWWDAFNATPEGHAFHLSSTYVLVELDEKGAFKVRGLVPGDYIVVMMVPEYDTGKDYSYIEHPFTVPESKEPAVTDLGELTLIPYPNVTEEEQVSDKRNGKGQIMGIVDLSGEHPAEDTVVLHRLDETGFEPQDHALQDVQETKTDIDGCFIFDSVEPGWVELYRFQDNSIKRKSFASSGSRGSQHRKVFVEPWGNVPCGAWRAAQGRREDGRAAGLPGETRVVHLRFSGVLHHR